MRTLPFLIRPERPGDIPMIDEPQDDNRIEPGHLPQKSKLIDRREEINDAYTTILDSERDARRAKEMRLRRICVVKT